MTGQIFPNPTGTPTTSSASTDVVTVSVNGVQIATLLQDLVTVSDPLVTVNNIMVN